ncbi:hypothetical protein [Brachybacterium subflavum]|uniref:hypothetical protein n=1 Tax=Brachybacterium subflavum TaxID=2585206 RepID=UPI001266861E|nr:hypothetical protein [Brachybacterium subflavum]
MRLSHLVHAARHALRTQKGRQAAGSAADAVAGAARKRAPAHAQKIDRAHRSARGYLDRR